MITIAELINQIEKVEGIKIGVMITQLFESVDLNAKIYKDYPYSTPMSGDKTVDNLLNERIYPAVYERN